MNIIKIIFLLLYLIKTLNNSFFKKTSIVLKFRKKIDKNKNRSYTFNFKINKLNF